MSITHDDVQNATLEDHEQRLRNLESVCLELTTNINAITKMARVGLMVIAAGLGVDITGVGM
tara:strand:- start:140 stop:325 length:186 start_codon:yes stop_codon:yes gene_type:complete